MMTPARILVVEDDRVVALDIAQQLRRIGHDVVAMATRGEDALPIALDRKPELVLMDIRLEGALDGVDAAGLIRERCHIPVVFLTAYADDETVRRASVTEPFGYLLKPFEDSQLRTVIEMSLYKHAAERKLRNSERRFVATLSSIGDAVIATDDQSRISFMNPVAETLTGWSGREAAGRPLEDVFRIFNEKTREPVEDPAAKVLRLGTTVGLANHTVLLARDGREVPIDDCGSPIVDDHGDIIGAVVVFRDISESRNVEEALRKSQVELARVARMTTMGELSASIAHEVNQPLTSIVASAEACLRWLTRDEPNVEEARKAANRVVRDGRYAGDVISSIRRLIRNASPEMAQLDMNALIEDSLELLRAELRHNGVALTTELASGLELAIGDRVQLQQVIVNLITNAIEATQAVAGRPGLVRVSTQRNHDGNVVISVADSGVGLDPAIRARIFDALFTTKQQGMGMGLSICRSIIGAHGGRIWALPNLPHGTVFQFTLPTRTEASPCDRLS